MIDCEHKLGTLLHGQATYCKNFMHVCALKMTSYSSCNLFALLISTSTLSIDKWLYLHSKFEINLNYKPFQG